MSNYVEVDSRTFRYYGGNIKVTGDGRFFVPFYIAERYRLTIIPNGSKLTR